MFVWCFVRGFRFLGGRLAGALLLIGLVFCYVNQAWAAGSSPSSQWVEEVVSTMTKEKLNEFYDYPYSVGDLDEDIDAWPLYFQDVTGINQIGYVYESISFSSIPGFMGVPYNLLVAISNEGVFLDTRVLYHREPMFMGGIGEIPLFDFVEQYKDLSLTQSIKFRENHNQRSDGKGPVYIDGISGATASVRVLNQTLLSSALKVARAKLGFGVSKSPDMIARIDREVFQPLDWAAMLKEGLVHRAVLTSDNAVSLFDEDRVDPNHWTTKGTATASSEPVELYVTDLMIPSVGQSLLTDELWAIMNEELDEGDHALLVVSTGRYSFKHSATQRGGISDRLTLRQQGLPIELRDLDFEDRLDDQDERLQLRIPDGLKSADWMVYRVLAAAGLDVAQPLEFDMSVVLDDLDYRSTIARDFPFQYQVPDDYFYEPKRQDSGWQSVWIHRAWELGLLALALATLFVVLSRSKPALGLPFESELWMRGTQATAQTATQTRANSIAKKRFDRFRLGFMLFTLGFIGWYAQGQLSIVNITGAIQSLMAGGDLGFFLYDPISTLLWCTLILTFFIWGRGPFCGWLCPFGALQELVTKAAARLRIRQFKPSDLWDARLKKLKYLILLAIVVTAFWLPDVSNQLVEIEPFKTSITYYFDRTWPYVLWAVALVAFSLVTYKGYCRYLCPLGAAMAVLGKVRLLDWLPRREECGSPCQWCRHSCEYNAIKKNGAIDYDECFQCLDCVVIYENDDLCVPLIVENKTGRKISSKETSPALIASDA